MQKPVSITLRINGKEQTFEQKFVPFRKHIEMLEMNAQLEEEPMPAGEWFVKKVTFIASLFDSKEVTKDSIIDGLSATNADEVMENIIAEMLGVDPNETAEE